MRGIVTSAGGPVYFANAFINLWLLRHDRKCQSPIEWFYMGDEMKPEWLALVEQEIPGVTFRDLGSICGHPCLGKDHTKGNGGYQSKIEAIIESSFDEVLFLDADSFPLRDPAYLFDHADYQATGAMLWQDCRRWREQALKFLDKVYGVTLPKREVESGQMLFDRQRVMAGLLKVRELNQNPDTYKVLFGDKDTFQVGFLQAKMPYSVNQHRVSFMDGGLSQPDLDGKELFRHATGSKFQPPALTPKFALPGFETLASAPVWTQLKESLDG